MSASNRFSGAITITPPLNAAETRRVPISTNGYDAHLRINEATEQTADGEIIRRTADAIVGPTESCSGYDVAEQIQTIVDLFPDRGYAGFIELDPDPGYGESTPSRYVVRVRAAGDCVGAARCDGWPGRRRAGAAGDRFDGRRGRVVTVPKEWPWAPGLFGAVPGIAYFKTVQLDEPFGSVYVLFKNGFHALVTVNRSRSMAGRYDLRVIAPDGEPARPVGLDDDAVILD